MADEMIDYVDAAELDGSRHVTMYYRASDEAVRIVYMKPGGKLIPLSQLAIEKIPVTTELRNLQCTSAD